MTFQSVLDREPLLHEPGIRPQHHDFKSYHTIVEYKNFEFACMELLTNVKTHIAVEFYPEFEEFMLRQFNKNKEQIRKTIEANSKTVLAAYYRISLYGGININVNYDLLLKYYDTKFYPMISNKLPS